MAGLGSRDYLQNKEKEIVSVSFCFFAFPAQVCWILAKQLKLTNAVAIALASFRMQILSRTPRWRQMPVWRRSTAVQAAISAYIRIVSQAASKGKSQDERDRLRLMMQETLRRDAS